MSRVAPQKPSSGNAAQTKWFASGLRATGAALSLAGMAICLVGGCASSPAPTKDAADTSLVLAHELGVPAASVTPSPMTGIYRIEHEHAFGYASADGRYLLRGDLLDRTTDHNLTDDARRADRLAAVGAMDAITFAPEAPVVTKYVVTVFTDVDCGYCRRFHSQIRDYNADGIAVRYLSWPRTGPDSESWQRAEAVWCAQDRMSALTAAKLGQPVQVQRCDSAVAREYELGIELGVHGTPTMILPDGSLVAGYLPPEQVLAKLEARSMPGANAPSRTIGAAAH